MAPFAWNHCADNQLKTGTSGRGDNQLSIRSSAAINQPSRSEGLDRGIMNAANSISFGWSGSLLITAEVYWLIVLTL
jgi:hypothetical protein